MKNSLCYTQAHSFNFDKIIEDIVLHSPDEVILFGEIEWEIKIPSNFVDVIKQKNIKLRVVTAGSSSQYYTDFYTNLGLGPGVVEFWPTYWINWTEILLTNGGFDHRTYVVNDNFKYPFINLNNKSHRHRCAIVDALAKEELIDKGVVTWHKFLNQHQGYSFKYFDNNTRILDDEFDKKLDPYILPKEFHESFFHLVSEATDIVNFPSEKVTMPIMLKKPWVCMAGPGFHKFMQDIGFVMFDEIINYDFDSVEDTTIRAEMIATNIKKITEVTDFTKLYRSLIPKIEHNYNNFIRIATTIDYFPPAVMERLEYMKTPGYKRLFTDHRYQAFLARTKC